MINLPSSNSVVIHLTEVFFLGVRIKCKSKIKAAPFCKEEDELNKFIDRYQDHITLIGITECSVVGVARALLHSSIINQNQSYSYINRYSRNPLELIVVLNNMPNKYPKKKDWDVPKQKYKLSNWSDYNASLLTSRDGYPKLQ